MGNIVLKDDTPDRGEIVVYQPDDVTRLEVRVNEDTVWLTQAQLASLFQKDQSVIARHIRNVFSEGELDEDSNMHILHNTLSRYKPVKIYSLDVIISVGYRVKSFRGIQFRRWATTVLKEYMLKGYSINQRLNAIEDKLDRKSISSSVPPCLLLKVFSMTGRFLMPMYLLLIWYVLQSIQLSLSITT
jgi:hypothetical protein